MRKAWISPTGPEQLHDQPAIGLWAVSCLPVDISYVRINLAFSHEALAAWFMVYGFLL
jgi:hypothetical protein